MGFEEDIREFLIESNEALENLDREIVELERAPRNMQLVSSAFRAVHTIKGTSSFFGFDLLGALTHVTENILSQVRDGERELTPELISLILSALDEVKILLASIKATGQEGPDRTEPLRVRMNEAYRSVLPEKLPEGIPHALAPASPGTEAPREAAAPEAQQQSVSRGGFQRLRKRPPPSQAQNNAVASEPEPETKAAVQEASTLAAKRPVPPPAATAPTAAAVVSSAPAPTGDPSGAARQVGDSTIRVDVGLLNRLMNLVGELVLARNQLLQEAPVHSLPLQQTSQRLNLITSELQEGVMKTRMQPIGVVWNKLPRVVRDLASQCGKKIRVEMEGADTDLDKTIIEAIKDPLTHVVRNCCDHGIEMPEKRIAKGKIPEGLIQLRAYHEGGVVNIEVSDDGSGIDPERVKSKAIEKGILRAEQAAQMTTREALHLIFLPGFSTAAQVTSISGRGVGMDVVKNNIEKIGGNVEVLAPPEGGTTIRIKIPLTLAIIPGLVVTLEKQAHAGAAEVVAEDRGPAETRQRWRSQERFIIPQANLVELVRIQAGEQSRRIDSIHGTPVFHHRGKLLPLLYLGSVLGQPQSDRAISDVTNIVVLQAENRQMGLVVDQICDTQEIVVKPLGRQLKGLSCYVGATIMGDGRPALILDVVGLAHLGGISAVNGAAAKAESAGADQTARTQKLLVFRAGIYDRVAVPLSLVDRLEEIDAATIKRAAGRPVLHYRGEILPLLAMPEPPMAGKEAREIGSGLRQVIVFSDGRRRTGVLVDQIIDILEEAVTARRSVSAPGILGSAIIGGQVTDLLDLEFLLASAGEGWLQQAKSGSTPRLLLLEGRTAARELLHGFLETSGYSTVSTGTLAEADLQLQHSTFDLALTSIDVGGQPEAGLDFLQTVRRDEALKHMPVIAMLSPERGSVRQSQVDRLADFDACVYKDQRDELLHALTATLAKDHAPRLQEVLQ